MLREDKSAWIETVEMDDAETTRLLSLAQEASMPVNELEREVKQLEITLTHARPREVYDRAALVLLEAQQRLAQQQARLAEAQQRADEHRLRAPKVNVYRLRSKNHYVEFSKEEYARHAQTQMSTPVLVTQAGEKRWWWYLDRFWWESEGLSPTDVQVLVLQRERKKQATLERARAEVYGGESPRSPDASRARRDPIPESVRHEVWRRDQGRCVDCGSRENLEFDHIIPVSRGGANTVRNIELRCESCNRRKGATI